MYIDIMKKDSHSNREMIDQSLKTWPFSPFNRGKVVWGGSLCLTTPSMKNSCSMFEVCGKVKPHLPTVTYMVRPEILYDTILNTQNRIFNQPPLTQAFNK